MAGIHDPEQSILPAQPLQPHVDPHTQKAEPCKEQEWQPPPANKNDKDATHRVRSNARLERVVGTISKKSRQP
jgi:hypothetical protein